MAEGFDPTETLDIDPNDLTLETNPYYGGADDPDDQSSTAVIDADAAVEVAASGVGDADVADADLGLVSDVDVDGNDGEFGMVDRRATDYSYADQAEAEAGEYGYSPAADATIEVPSPADDQLGFDGGPPSSPPIDQPVPMGEGFGGPEVDYSSGPVLTPMSSPPPKPGAGRTVLYAIIGLLALAVAGVAGYLLFQLQGDDGDTSGAGDNEGAAAVAGNDAGPSNTSGQEAGSFSNPHELLGGVRLTVPLGDENREVWMLQVREQATSSDIGDDQVEVTSRVRVRNDSPSGDLSASGLRFVLVAADGSAGTTAAASCSSGDDLDREAAIEPGKDIEGNVCWTVPAAQASGALLGIESVHAAGRIHVQLS